MKAIKFGLVLGALMLAGIGAAEAQALKVGRTPPLPGQVLFQTNVIQAVAKDAGLQITFVDMPFGDLQQALVDKKIDIIASVLTPTPERAKLVDFSQSYGSYRDVGLFLASDTKTYKTLADFKGVNVDVTRGAFYVDPLKAAGANVTLVEVTDQGIADVEAGKVAGYFTVGPTATFLLPTHPKLRIVDSYPPMLASDVAFSVQKGNTALLAKINASLTKLKADGSVKKMAQEASYSYP
jgi:polar amino acid transport system substrate-binding protein